MRILLLHAERFEYETQKKALKATPDPPGRGSCANCLVAMITVEDGDTILTAREAAASIVDVHNRVKAGSIMLYPYAHLSSNLAPPKVAVELLKAIEGQIASEGIPVERSPFGWYKRFSITVYGHPLSELSREIRADALYYLSGGEEVPVKQAISRGLLPEDLEKTFPGKDTLDVLNRLGIEPLSGSGYEMMRSIAERIAGPLSQVRVHHLGDAWRLTGLDLAKITLKACNAVEKEPTLIYTPLDSIVVAGGRLDDILDSIYKHDSENTAELSIGEGGLAVPGLNGEGRLLLYKFKEGGMAPLGVEVNGRACIGPLRGLIMSIVDSELARRSSDDGYTPMLPPWMHFIHVALIPVSQDQLEAARRAASMLSRVGARVAILGDTSTRLGLRVRRAAQLWVPIVGVIGRREAEEGVITVRRRWEPGSQEAVKPEELVSEVEEILGPPRIATL